MRRSTAQATHGRSGAGHPGAGQTGEGDGSAPWARAVSGGVGESVTRADARDRAGDVWAGRGGEASWPGRRVGLGLGKKNEKEWAEVGLG